MKPVPMPPPVPVCDWILTTAGMAPLTALITADDSSMCTCETLVPSGSWAVGEPFSSASRVVTAAADSDAGNDAGHAANATTPPPATRRRSVGRGGAVATGGCVDHGGTPCDGLPGASAPWGGTLFGEGAACVGGGPNRRASTCSVDSSPVRGGEGFLQSWCLAFFVATRAEGNRRDAARPPAAGRNRAASRWLPSARVATKKAKHHD